MNLRSAKNLFLALSLSSFCGLCAWFIHRLPFAPFTVNGSHPVDVLALALVVGIISKSFLNLSKPILTKIKSISQVMLAIGIALLGAKLNLAMIIEHSSHSLFLSFFCVVITLILTESLGIKLGVPRRLSRLIAIGTAICGGTAIAVTSSSVKATDEEIALSIATVTLFGISCMLFMPAIGTYLALSQDQFGLWAGLLVHATPQVIATAYSYGTVAGEIAIIVKLTRVMMLVPLLICLQVLNQRTQSEIQSLSHLKTGFKLTQVFPPFLLVFIFLASINSLGYIPKTLPSVYPLSSQQFDTHQVLNLTSKIAMLVAMAAIGLLVDMRKLMALGYKPLIGGLLATVIVGSISLAMLY